MFIYSAVLITGGFNTGSAELYNPFTNTSCLLPQLPEGRGSHCQEGNLACGGGSYSSSTQHTCVKWNPASGTWMQSHNISGGHFNSHVSWATSSGVYLIGGTYGSKTSTKVQSDGSVEEGFGLKHYTRFLLNIPLTIQYFVIFNRSACAISDPERKEVIITGGATLGSSGVVIGAATTVSIYSEAGWKTDLASLNQGRYNHACGSYVNRRKKVNHFLWIFFLISKYKSTFNCQFIIVTGGGSLIYDQLAGTISANSLDSTEIFSDNAWTVTGKLQGLFYVWSKSYCLMLLIYECQ